MPRGVDRHDRVAGLRTLQGYAARARATTDLVDRGPTKTTLLADALAKELSPLAASHLRRARVARTPPATSADLGPRLRALGVRHVDALLAFEAAAGASGLPGGRALGVSPFVERIADLPRVDGEVVFPILGLPEHVAEWESRFAMLGPDGVVSFHDAPEGPVRALGSWLALVELEALAPLDGPLAELWVDGRVGALVADLAGALPHPPACGVGVSAWAGGGVYVRELRTGLAAWTRLEGTSIRAEDGALLDDLASLLAEQGHTPERGPARRP